MIGTTDSAAAQQSFAERRPGPPLFPIRRQPDREVAEPIRTIDQGGEALNADIDGGERSIRANIPYPSHAIKAPANQQSAVSGEPRVDCRRFKIGASRNHTGMLVRREPVQAVASSHEKNVEGWKTRQFTRALNCRDTGSPGPPSLAHIRTQPSHEKKYSSNNRWEK